MNKDDVARLKSKLRKRAVERRRDVDEKYQIGGGKKNMTKVYVQKEPTVVVKEKIDVKEL